jgi:hypothetical protein
VYALTCAVVVSILRSSPSTKQEQITSCKERGYATYISKTLWFLAIGLLSIAISAQVNAAYNSSDNNFGTEVNCV